MKNYESNFARILRQIATEEGYDLSSYSEDWAFAFRKDNKECFVVGYQFPLNKAAAKDVCQDKALCSEILNERGIPAADHIYLPCEALRMYMNLPENEQVIREALTKYGTIVLKENDGTGGLRCFKVKNVEEASAAAEQIFAHSDAMALSPFLDIQEEYRMVMLDGEPRLVIRKERMSVTGDGIRTVEEIAREENLTRYLAELSDDEKSRVPYRGEKVYLTWKHNLGQGAYGEICEDPEIISRLSVIAKRVCEAVSIRFCSVDMVLTEGGVKVLEVNAGVMMEHFSGQSEACFTRAKEIYRDALKKSFQELS